MTVSQKNLIQVRGPPKSKLVRPPQGLGGGLATNVPGRGRWKQQGIIKSRIVETTLRIINTFCRTSPPTGRQASISGQSEKLSLLSL